MQGNDIIIPHDTNKKPIKVLMHDFFKIAEAFNWKKKKYFLTHLNM